MPRIIIRLAWAWMILIGYILITPIGPICIACGSTLQPQDSLGRSAIVTLGIITAVLGITGFALVDEPKPLLQVRPQDDNKTDHSFGYE